MRTGGYTIQQTLTTEAASVLKHSLTLARRRGHAQVTPLHVAATLLSSRTSLLRRACIKSHPGFSTNYQFATSRNLHHNHPLQCRALELCFNVALNRLPTVPAPMFHGQPSLANALIAALKRAQAHQRRGCIEQQQTQTQTQQQQQQPQLLAVKVELEQLVISILDDPSVSRVMREAGFNSTAVKNCVEDCSVVSSVFYGSSVGVFSSPNSPNNDHQTLNRFPHYQNPKDFNFINPNFTLWQTHFLNHSPDQNPLLIPSSHHQNRLREVDVKLVVDVLVNKKRKNPVIIGDSTSFIEGFVSELIIKLERGEIDGIKDLKQTHFVKFQFSPISSKFMRREDVEINIRELRKKVISFTSSGKNVIIYTGDLNWTIREINNNNGGIREISSSYSPVDHIVEELGKLIAEYNDKLDQDDDDDDDDDGHDDSEIDGSSKVWVMGTASFQTYMRCQMRQPSLETLWALHPVSVPSSATLGLSLHATSVHEARNMSTVPSQVTESKSSKAEEETRNSVLSCCLECVSSYEKEAKAIKVSREKLLPSWLLPNDGDNSLHKEELMGGLRRKWNKFCESLHQERPNHQTGQLNLLGKNFSCGFPYGSSRSGSLMDSLGLKPNQRVVTNSIAKFRRQNSCTIEFDLGGNEYEKGESMNEVEDNENVKITLDLGNSLFRSDSGTERRKMSDLVKTLQQNIPWKTETIRLISQCVMNCVSKKKDGWIMIEGSDVAAKRRLARTVSESVFGSVDSLLHLDLKKRNNESMEILASGLKNREKVVFLIEDIDSADVNFLKLLTDRFEENQRGEFGKDRQGVFILTKEDSEVKNRDFVVQIGLEITEQSLEKKRKRPESGFGIKREVYSRQSSFASSLDLNIKAEEEEDDEGEISPISSDLTRDETEISSNDFLNRIENRFVLDRACEPEMKKAITCRITAAFREIFPEDYSVVRFSVEEKLVEELCGNVQNGAFESWLKEVFQKGLLTVQKGGKKDRVVIRMVFGGIVDNKQYGGVGGYIGTCLPNKVQVSKFE